MKVGYLDCFSGVSGDMMLGALLDAGLPLDSLKAELAKLPLSGYEISAEKASRGIITGTKAHVIIESSDEERSLADILSLIDSSSLSQEVKSKASLVFHRLAEAEAHVHHCPVEKVHFHEVGAIDAIVDVVGSVIGLELLGIKALFAAALPAGSGTVKTDHGTIPVPAPATLELIATAKALIRPTSHRDPGELVTPTGAAIVTSLASFTSPTLSLERIGYGVGSRDLAAMPNVLPLWIGESAAPERGLLLIETNIDNMNPELYGHVMERLFQEGALDVWFTPIQMKKNHPATMLSIIAPGECQGGIVEAMLKETSTLGVRIQMIARHESGREFVPFDCSLGKVTIKVKRFGGVRVGFAPEYEECRRLAREHSLPLQEVYRIITVEASRFLEQAG